MKIAYLGNFGVDFSTESHIKTALEANDHTVIGFQESEPEMWTHLTNQVSEFDFILWTRTGWSPPIPRNTQDQFMAAARNAGVPIIGYHLDRWFGLHREGDIRNDNFFKADLNITADGHPAHQALFEEAGVNHVWFPPGVSEPECHRTAAYAPEYNHDVVFCGSSDSYHKEWNYRVELVQWLRDTFGDRLGVYPGDQPALRNQPLMDLYGNAKVIVGDSCLNGGITNYWSDRIPETLGRGGFLIHPFVEGLDAHYTHNEHYIGYDLGQFDALKVLIEQFVEDNVAREKIAAQGREHVLKTATYEIRMRQLVDLLIERGMI